MKRFLFVLAVMFLLGGASAMGAGPVSINATTGLYYNTADYTNLDPDFGDTFALFYCFRGGASLMAGYNLNDFMTVGGEVGILGNVIPYNGTIGLLLDIPIRAYFDMHLGEVIGVSALGGGLLSFTPADSDFAMEAGVRGYFLGMYLEAVYVFDETPYQRYGLGYIMPLM